MTDELKTYDWDTNSYKQMPGTEDWKEVADLDFGDYSWTTFRVYYSPSSRRYFWHGDSGCSCNNWAKGVASSADFSNGDKEAAARAWESFARDYEYSIHTSDYISGAAQIREFRP